MVLNGNGEQVSVELFYSQRKRFWKFPTEVWRLKYLFEQ